MKDKFTLTAAIGGLLACLIGLAYLYVASAPASMIIVNFGSLVIGLLLLAVMRFTVPMTDRLAAAIALGGALVLAGTAAFGYAIEGASRWVLVGPFFVQTSLILLPVIALAYARVQNITSVIAVVIAALAIAFQPDRAGAGMLCLIALGVFAMQRSMRSAALLAFCGMAFGATLLLPDRLPAVPYVDHILWTAFDVNPLVGLSLWLGSALLVLPAFVIAGKERTQAHYTFALCWVALVGAAAIGAYPTPIVGYGSSAIIGYFLSVAFAGPRIFSHSGKTSSQDRREASDGNPPVSERLFPA
ncbi:hypothetical protein [Erythrobacter sp. F6033]|uniref:hypothetical protein n=1 Tax=Erythrobacter sp. F6033 TaxID=2926401 RepID=UPI001FF557BF|nr:hypothetical protein [Erythrobacter sp. F6033]MCK0128686.1 hypothetical protein [Erythrobacter sp. F6033]